MDTRLLFSGVATALVSRGLPGLLAAEWKSALSLPPLVLEPHFLVDIVNPSSTAPKPDFASSFVVEPTVSAEHRPWGQWDVGVGLASHRFRFFGLSQTQRDVVHSLYSSYVMRRASTDEHRVNLFATSSDLFRLFDRRGWTYDMEFEYGPETVWVAGWGFLGLVHLSPAINACLWTCLQHSDDFHSVFENFFRVILAYTLNRDNGILLHCSGAIFDNRACLFIGQSGAGKSTVCGISRDAGLEVLSDDLNAVVLRRSVPEVEKLPFAGEPRFRSDNSRRYPVDGLYKLHKDEKVGLNTLSPASSIATVCGNAPFVNRNPHVFHGLIRTATALVKVRPVRELSFRPDPSFLELLGARSK